MFIDVRARTVSGFLLAGILIGCVTFGVKGIQVIMVLVGLGMIYEWLSIVGLLRKSLFLIQALGVFIPVGVVMLREPLLAMGMLFLLSSSTVFFRELYGHSMVKVALGTLLIGLCVLSVFVTLTFCQNGFFMILWAALIIISMDVGGYFWGSWVRGPKMCPSISPSKTWSGFLGGMIVAMFVATLLYCYYFEAMMPISMLWRIAILSTMAVLGDFFESWVKRRHGVKNSGSLIPGHGGVLDRFDGYLLVMPTLQLFIYVDRFFMVSFGEFDRVL